LAALGLRVGYLLAIDGNDDGRFYDWIFYRAEARALADGHGFVEPGLNGNPPVDAKPAADHPPLFAMILAPVARLTDGSDFAMRLVNCLIGAFGVILIGFLGREVVDETTGLLAAGFAALYPNLWVNDALIMPESLGIVIVTAALFLTYRLLREPSIPIAAALGAVIGLGVLTRGELTLLGPVLCIPAAIVAFADDRRRQLYAVGAIVAAAGLLVMPWVAYNMTRFERPVFVSTNFDLNLLGSSCPDAYSGPHKGSLGFCTFLKFPETGDQSVAAAAQRQQAIDYIKDHLSAYPEVVAARIGRTWSLYRPLDALDVGEAEGRPPGVTAAGLVAFYLLGALAIAGVIVARKQRIRIWPLLMPALVVTAAMLVSYGQVRYRTSAEPTVVVLAAIGAVALWRRLRTTGAARPGPAAGPLASPG
jgi:4-amino-4-deoxy-L-arabinose transferase-like glycosyltransferase